MNVPAANARRRPRAVLVGDASPVEMASCADWLAECADVSRFVDAETAAKELAEGTCEPEVIVLAQSRPDQFSSAQIDRLRRAAPLSPVVSLLGSWCEGEMRTGFPYPGVMRVYWHQWFPRVARELERIAAHGCPIWSLPPTVSENDRWLVRGAEASRPRHDDRAAHRGLVAICAMHDVTAGGLADSCRDAGFAVVSATAGRTPMVAGADAAILDGHRNRNRLAEEIGQLTRLPGPAPIVVLMNFPRVEDVQFARSAGATAVVSKPFFNDDLVWQLDRMIGRRRQAPNRQDAA